MGLLLTIIGCVAWFTKHQIYIDMKLKADSNVTVKNWDIEYNRSYNYFMGGFTCVIVILFLLVAIESGKWYQGIPITFIIIIWVWTTNIFARKKPYK
jgi:hypothetical protein